MPLNALADPANLGNILLKMGSVQLDRLKEAVVAQMDNRDLRLGTVLVSLGLVNQVDLAYALNVQNLMRRGKDTDAAMAIMDYQLTQGAKSAAKEGRLADATLQTLTPPNGTAAPRRIA